MTVFIDGMQRLPIRVLTSVYVNYCSHVYLLVHMTVVSCELLVTLNIYPLDFVVNQCSQDLGVPCDYGCLAV